MRKGEVDLECSTTTWTLSRQSLVDFSLVTFVDGGSLLVRAQSDIGRLPDLDGKRIAVIAGTTTEKALRDALDAPQGQGRAGEHQDARRGARPARQGRGGRASPPTARR